MEGHIAPQGNGGATRFPVEHSIKKSYESGRVGAVAIWGELLVLFQLGEYCLDLRKFFWRDTRKRNPKTIAINPTDRCFLDPQWPIKAWNVESTFELRALLHHHVAFNFTTARRNIQSSSLPLLFFTRESAAKLRGESRLDSPVLWPRLRRSLIGGIRREERTEFLQRGDPSITNLFSEVIDRRFLKPVPEMHRSHGAPYLLVVRSMWSRRFC